MTRLSLAQDLKLEDKYDNFEFRINRKEILKIDDFHSNKQLEDSFK